MKDCAHLQLLVIEDVEQLLHQAIGGQRFAYYIAEQLFAMLQFSPWSFQKRVTQPIDSCWNQHNHQSLPVRFEQDTPTNLLLNQWKWCAFAV